MKRTCRHLKQAMIGEKNPSVEEYSKLFLEKLPMLQSKEKLPSNELIELVMNTQEIYAEDYRKVYNAELD